MNYLDRNNIAAARLRGLQEDLSLNETEYATCLSILYVGYILMQVPSNMIINKIQRPSWYIGAAILLWGMISTLSGSVHNFEGMIAVRFFLGFVEAAFLRRLLLPISPINSFPFLPVPSLPVPFHPFPSLPVPSRPFPC